MTSWSAMVRDNRTFRRLWLVRERRKVQPGFGNRAARKARARRRAIEFLCSLPLPSYGDRDPRGIMRFIGEMDPPFILYEPEGR